MNVTSGSTQVLAVAAEPHGFVSAGSHDRRPAVWTTTDGRLWTTIVLAMPAGASSAALRQVAVNGNRVVAFGQAITAGGPAPFAELSADGGASWRQVRFRPPGPGTVITALIACKGGFAAAGRYRTAGRQAAAAWTSASGTTWTPAPAGPASWSVVTAREQRFLLVPQRGQ